MTRKTRRAFLREMGLTAGALPFILNLPSLGFANSVQRKQRLVIMFSPNGVVPWNFWPEETGEEFTLKEILQPLEPYKDRTLILRGVSNKIRGDGDNHMRGMACLLTGIELFPGNVQGGSHTPAGWAKGLSIDQEITRFLQSSPETRTRFGSLEFGIGVPDRADPWTRLVYAGPNKPVAPVMDPYQMLNKLYGQTRDLESLGGILDDVQDDLRRLRGALNPDDRRLLEEHESFVRAMELDLQESRQQSSDLAAPELESGVKNVNDNLPKLAQMQIDLLVHSFVADFARVATVQITNSVGGARMRWLGIDEGHHELSHHSDKETESQDKLTKINKWYCEQMAYLVRKLDETPEPGGSGTLLDNTTILWTNELGKGNSHTLDNIPFVLVGNGLGFRMGRALKYDNVPHNRLLLSLAHAMGHPIDRFGNPDQCQAGELSDLA